MAPGQKGRCCFSCPAPQEFKGRERLALHRQKDSLPEKGPIVCYLPGHESPSQNPEAKKSQNSKVPFSAPVWPHRLSLIRGQSGAAFPGRLLAALVHKQPGSVIKPSSWGALQGEPWAGRAPLPATLSVPSAPCENVLGTNSEDLGGQTLDLPLVSPPARVRREADSVLSAGGTVRRWVRREREVLVCGAGG